jgi:hypothetical protein
MSYRGPFCSEQTDIKIEDCVAASGIDIGRGAGLTMPVGRVEREALRVASADTQGGMDLVHLANGMEKRYGHRPRASHDWAYVAAHPERWFVCIGQYTTLSAHLRRWQPNGSFLHACAFGPGTTATNRWWANPLAPPTYNGEVISLVQLRKYMATFNYEALSFAEDEFKEVTDMGLEFNLLPGPSGSLVVTTPGTYYVTVADAVHHGPIAPPFPKALAYPVKLTKPLDKYPGDRQTGYLIGATAAFLLASNVKFTPNPPLNDCTAAVEAATKPLEARISAAKTALG